MEKKQVVEEKTWTSDRFYGMFRKIVTFCSFLLLDFYFIDVNNTIFNVQPSHTCIRFLAMGFFFQSYTIIHDEINKKYLSIS